MPATLLFAVVLAGTMLQASSAHGNEVVTGATLVTSTTLAGDSPPVLPAAYVQRDATPGTKNVEPLTIEKPSEFVVHGFLSQGYIRSTANNYLVKSRRGSFEFSEVGGNVTKALTDRLSVGVQLFSQATGTAGRFETTADWFQLDYRYDDWLGIRAGRVKLPFGLYNDISDVDSARVPILLPQSIYPIQNRNFLLAQSGGEAYGYIPAGKAGTLEYRVYGGTIILDIDSPSATRFTLLEATTPYIIGSRILWETPLTGLRFGASVQSLRLDAELFFPAVTQDVTVEIPALQWVGSAEYVLDAFEASAEYSRWNVTTRSSEPALFPRSNVVSERMYVMATYRTTEWLQVGGYFSRLVPNIGDRAGRDWLQDDWAATLRFDVNAYWLIKLEGHFMNGTAGLSADLNRSIPRTDLEEKWGLFLLKTTAYF